MLEIRRIISEYDSIKDHSTIKVALASVVSVEASAYRRVGARMLVNSNGIWVGGISGGCLEGDALNKSLNAIYKNESSIIVYDTMEDDSSQIGVGLGCNGRIEVLLTPIDPNDPNNEIELLRSLLYAEKPSIIAKVISKHSSSFSKCQMLDYNVPGLNFMNIKNTSLQEAIHTALEKKSPRIFNLESSEGDLKVLLEFIRPETRLIIVGDSYDVNAMVNVAETLGWEIWIVGRMKKLTKELVKRVQKVIPFKEHEQIKTHDYTAVVLMSHDYKWDLTILQHFIKNNPPYIGILGPKKRFQKMDKELSVIELEKINYIYSPTGLEIGAETPEEISLSIAAEIIAVFRNKKGLFLKLKDGSIHTREQ
ncbi:MAG: xanthine dehydrogenase accessory factor [Patescibacteria group bacterium]|jgi:xanthine dehydrogenase accessory factor